MTGKSQVYIARDNVQFLQAGESNIERFVAFLTDYAGLEKCQKLSSLLNTGERDTAKLD